MHYHVYLALDIRFVQYMELLNQAREVARILTEYVLRVDHFMPHHPHHCQSSLRVTRKLVECHDGALPSSDQNLHRNRPNRRYYRDNCTSQRKCAHD